MMTVTYFDPNEGMDLEILSKEAEIARFEGVETQGFQLLVLLYIPPKKHKGIYIPDATHDDYRFRACTGLVVQKGRDSYGKRFDSLADHKVWCNIGDWIAFPRHEGIQLKIDGKECQFLNDASVLAKIDDPRRIMR